MNATTTHPARAALARISVNDVAEWLRPDAIPLVRVDAVDPEAGTVVVSWDNGSRILKSTVRANELRTLWPAASLHDRPSAPGNYTGVNMGQPTPLAVVEEILRLRTAEGLTQVAIARRCCLNVDTVCRILGKAKLTKAHRGRPANGKAGGQ